MPTRFQFLINVVNDEDFEYALNECLAAYNNALYLATTSTANTSMKTL